MVRMRMPRSRQEEVQELRKAIKEFLDAPIPPDSLGQYIHYLASKPGEGVAYADCEIAPMRRTPPASGG